MTVKKKRTWMDRLRTAFKAQDEAAMEEALEEAKDAEPDDKDKEDKAKTGDAAAIASMSATLDSLVKTVAKLVKDAEGKPDSDDEDKEKTGDTVIEAETAESNPDAKGKVLSGDSLKAVTSRAEILAPGIAVPTGDGASASAVEALQRKALTQAMTTDSGKAAVEVFAHGRDVTKLTGDALAAVFSGAAELIRAQNNDAGPRRSLSTKDFGRVTTVADINARNREFWAKGAR